jgi:hypothetical protein
MTKLTDAQITELGRLAGIQRAGWAHFAEAVERCVASYQRTLNQKPLSAVEEELKQLETRVQQCLALASHKAWRPGKFREGLEIVSRALTHLSDPARQFLAFRNARVVHAIPADWSPAVGSDVVIDPVCFSDFHDQLGALEDLFGALAGPVANRKHGRQTKDAERGLSHCLAVAFAKIANKPAGGSNSFLDVCNAIKNIYELNDWNPDSLVRSIRMDRAAK